MRKIHHLNKNHKTRYLLNLHWQSASAGATGNSFFCSFQREIKYSKELLKICLIQFGVMSERIASSPSSDENSVDMIKGNRSFWNFNSFRCASETKFWGSSRLRDFISTHSPSRSCSLRWFRSRIWQHFICMSSEKEVQLKVSDSPTPTCPSENTMLSYALSFKIVLNNVTVT